MQKKTIVYVDGYNLYYGLLKGTPYKWLDLVAFAQALLRADHEIACVKYFTAYAKTYPYDEAAAERQNVYMQALGTCDEVKVIHGFFRKSNVLMPAFDADCKDCARAQDGLVRVVKLEEKKSDVNLAVEMVLDAAQNQADAYVVITGDSDQVGAIEAVRYQCKKPVLVFNPHTGVSIHLKKAASYYKNIPRDLPAMCQLPDEIQVGTKGNVIRRPLAWKG